MLLLRGNLFIRMFISFWLVTITILGSWMLTTDYFDSRPDGSLRGQHRPSGPPHRFMLRTIYNLQTLEMLPLQQAVAQIRQVHEVDIYLLDKNNTDLFGRAVTADIKQVAAQLKRGRKRGFLDSPSGRLVAHEVYRREQGPLAAVFVFPTPRPGVLNTLRGYPTLRLLLAVVISGLLCFALSGLMTTRLKALQTASRRLANGDLHTRLQVRNKGGDETDELARDFNTMAAQLETRMEAQKRLLGDVSHELRSPLARLRVALALAEEDPSNNEKYLARIEQEATRLEELIEQLLSSQGKEIVLDAHIDLVALLQELCSDANFEGQRQNKRVSFAPTVEQAIVPSTGDLLHKSFENILRNALSHTPPDSQVAATLQLQDKHYLICVEDHGPGVPEEELKTIFTAFYRVDTARTPEAGGYGLGLAITHSAVLQHGGDVWAENTDDGLKIIVRLPVSL